MKGISQFRSNTFIRPILVAVDHTMADILPGSSDWAFLPAHLLDSIAEKLVTSYQLLRFPRLFPSYQVAAIYNDFCLVALIKSGDKASLPHRSVISPVDLDFYNCAEI